MICKRQRASNCVFQQFAVRTLWLRALWLRPFATVLLTATGAIGILNPPLSLVVAAASDHTTVGVAEAVSNGVKAAVPRVLHLPEVPYRYAEWDLPDAVRLQVDAHDNTPPDNPITDHGATLGRVLFYDTSLSQNGSVSCASCHQQSFAFSDDRQFSLGFDGQAGKRNSMSLVNLRFNRSGKFFWDERASSLEQQVLMPIEDPLEMGHSLPALVEQLAQDPLYPPLFRAAFGSPQITQQRIAQALAQFVRSIVSFQSRYDAGLQTVASVQLPFANFTDEENLGKALFFGQARCALCHLDDGGPPLPLIADDGFDFEFAAGRQAVLFQLSGAAVNGLEMEPYEVPAVSRQVGQQALQTPGHTFDTDIGLGAITGQANDIGRFKSQSLRNIALTAPFMHDGRFDSLEQVVEHYNWSIRPHRNLDPRLQQLGNSGIALPQNKVDALVAFLLTLTDESLISDSRFSDPFVHGTNQQTVQPSAADP